jgi:hypothetical protein
MIFPCLEIESILQVGDKTRLDGRKSFVAQTGGEIEIVRLRPEEGADFIDVTGTLFLDWQYAAPGEKTVTIEVQTENATMSLQKVITVISEEEDGLFSSDADLVTHEDDILRYVREGRSSFLDKHRAAQRLIVDYLDEQRLWDSEGNRLSKSALIRPEEIKSWATYLALSIIFEGISNATDDIFSVKAHKYRGLALEKKGRAVLRIDQTGNGEEDKRKSLASSMVVRR